MVASFLTATPPVARMLRPRSVALFCDATAGEGARLLANLIAGGFSGTVHPPPQPRAAVGAQPASGPAAPLPAAPLPVAPDLAVVCLPPAEAEEVLQALVARGAGGAILTGQAPPGLTQGGIRGLRVIGACSAGVMVPALGLNASLFPAMPRPGGVALVCHEGGFANAVLDHAAREGIGFSHVITLGRNDDLGFAEVLDFLSGEAATRAVLLEVGQIRNRRGFLSAARAVARGRAVVALRTVAEAPSGADETAPPPGLVFAAALRRAGIVDVAGLEEMLDAFTVLARPRRMRGERVLVVSTSRALGVIAAREAAAAGAHLPVPPGDAGPALSALAGDGADANPLLVPDGVPGERLGDLVAAASSVPGLADAVIAVHAPGPAEGEPAADPTAQALAAAHASERRLPIIAAWPGGASAEAGRALLASAGLPAFATIEAAARAAGTLIRHRRTAEAARELPPSTVLAVAPDRETVRRLLGTVRRAGRATLSEDEAAAVLAAYGIPVAPARVAADPGSAAEAAAVLGFPVVLKIRSPDLAHKTEVGGVVLDLDDREATRAAAESMAARVARRAPAARCEGFLVQRHIAGAGLQELFVRLGRDPLFGPAISFGQGGTAVGVAADLAADLPPLNRALALSMIGRTRVARLLDGFRDHPPADLDAIAGTIVRVSQLAVDFPDIVEAEVNPLLAGPSGVMALDAWIAIAPEPLSGTAHLAIAPYPAELVTRITLRGGEALTLRPIRPEDADAHAAFFRRLTPEDVRLRFFAPISALSNEQVARMTQIDYDREMALVATRGDADAAEILGIVRLIRHRDEAEFAIVVRSDAKGTGLGRQMMRAALAWAARAGIRRVVGDVLVENAPMLAFVRALGFTLARSPEDPEMMRASLSLPP